MTVDELVTTSEANDSPIAQDTAFVCGSKRWKVVANKLMCGDTVLPVAHRSEADLVEEVCGRTEPTHQKSMSDQQFTTDNNHSTSNHASKELAL